jgi:tRNA G37 N-methylase TrmD
LSLEGVQHLEAEIVKDYAQDLRNLLEEGDFTQSKTFLRSFVIKVIISGDKAKIQYRLPMQPDGKRTQSAEVLPIDTLGGRLGRVPELLFEKKGLRAHLQ